MADWLTASEMAGMAKDGSVSLAQPDDHQHCQFEVLDPNFWVAGGLVEELESFRQHERGF